MNTFSMLYQLILYVKQVTRQRAKSVTPHLMFTTKAVSTLYTTQAKALFLLV